MTMVASEEYLPGEEVCLQTREYAGLDLQTLGVLYRTVRRYGRVVRVEGDLVTVRWGRDSYSIVESRELL